MPTVRTWTYLVDITIIVPKLAALVGPRHRLPADKRTKAPG